MGETFVDAWENEVPASIEVDGKLFTRGDCDNSKWDGNFYTFDWEEHTEQNDLIRHRIVLRSIDNDSKHLFAEIKLEQPGISINVRHFHGEFVPYNSDNFEGGLYFDSIEECLESARVKYLELVSQLSHFEIGIGWEGE